MSLLQVELGGNSRILAAGVGVHFRPEGQELLSDKASVLTDISKV